MSHEHAALCLIEPAHRSTMIRPIEGTPLPFTRNTMYGHGGATLRLDGISVALTFRLGLERSPFTPFHQNLAIRQYRRIEVPAGIRHGPRVRPLRIRLIEDR